jgi:hypothetical protein
MRQTLWAEEMIRNKDNEIIKADEYHHVHIIPPENYGLLKKIYRCSKKEMEVTWRECINDNNKYSIFSPADFVLPIDHDKYKDLIQYLKIRYWNDDN